MPEIYGVVWNNVRAARVRKYRHIAYYIVVADRIDDDRFLQGERFLQLSLELGVGTGRWADRDAHDLLVLGALEQARDRRLRETHLRSDVGLTNASLVVEAGHFGDLAQFVTAWHITSRTLWILMPTRINIQAILDRAARHVNRPALMNFAC